jgi:DNA-binding CsgD family transcriptional regulator
MRTHLQNIHDKLGVTRRVQLPNYVRDTGLV